MSEEFDTNAAFLLFISAIESIVDDNDDCEPEIVETGRRLGTKLAADFCSRHLIFDKISTEEAVRYLPVFIKTYFSTSMCFNDRKIEIKNKQLISGGNYCLLCLSELFKSALGVFGVKIEYKIGIDCIFIITE